MMPGTSGGKLGGNGGIVEIGETYIGRDPAKKKVKWARGHKFPIVSLSSVAAGRGRYSSRTA
jgi:hypothetical protein